MNTIRSHHIFRAVCRPGITVAVLAAVAFPVAACGGQDGPSRAAPVNGADPSSETAQAPNAASGTTGSEGSNDNNGSGKQAAAEADPALVRWAGEVCGVVAAHTRDVTPPRIDPQDPQQTAKAFAWMFGTMESLMKEQRDGLASVSAPPAEISSQYTEALRRFDEARGLVGNAEAKLASVSPNNPKELVRALESVGEMEVGDKAYPGLVPDLSRLTPSFGAAAREARACDDVPGV